MTGKKHILTRRQLSSLIPILLTAEAWCKGVRELIESQVAAGVNIKGADLSINETKRRVWKETDTKALIRLVQDALKRAGKKSTQDEAAPRVVLSVAQLEKVVGKQAFSEDPIAKEVGHTVSRRQSVIITDPVSKK